MYIRKYLPYIETLWKREKKKNMSEKRKRKKLRSRNQNNKAYTEKPLSGSSECLGQGPLGLTAF